MLDLRALIAFAVVGISLATGGRAAASDGTRKVYDFGAQKQKGFLYAPPIPRWGGNASTLSFVASVNMTDISDSPEGPTWTFKYTYDGARNSSCYEHGPGQHDEVCKSIDKALTDQGHACTVLSSTDGHLYVSFPSDDKCCKCRHGFAVRSDWLFENSSYVGRGTVEGKTTDEWLKQGASDNHYYATADGEQRPVRYMEHKNGKLKQWDFGDWSAGTAGGASLDPPKGCDSPCLSMICLVI